MFWLGLDYFTGTWMPNTLSPPQRPLATPTKLQLRALRWLLIGLRANAQTSEERKNWDWCHTLRRAFFRRSGSHFEPKALREEEVDQTHKLFLQMKSAPVNLLYIKSTSIMKELNKIKKRDGEFGRKAKALRNKWANN
ncbi:hypothetical protein B0H13DRAFT_1884871 [Mycena leptocephala]|nr:hypothetical protein B0H13DRAFT_1884871 [Mycena leptocephala]